MPLFYFTYTEITNKQKEVITMFQYIKRFWKDNLIVGFLLFGSAGSQAIASMVNAQALNALIELDFNGFVTSTLRMFLSFMILLVFTYLQIVKQTKTIQKMVTAIREDITNRIEKTSYNAFHEKQVGTYVSWLSNDINILERQGFDALYTVIGGVISTITSIIALLFFHWSIAIWSLMATAITLLLPKIVEKKMGDAQLFVTQENEGFISTANDVLGGFDTLFSYNLLNKITRNMKSASLNLADAKTKQAHVIGKVAVLGAFGNVFGQLSVLILTGWLALRSIISLGALASTGGLASVIFNSIGNITQQIATIRSTKPIFEKFETISFDENQGAASLLDVQEGFSIQELSYSYGDKTVLEQLNFNFELKRKYAIVGSSGSGKTTLLNILNGKLTDYKGSITLSNQELKQLSGNNLRENILYIDQTPYLFHGTIRYNITLGEDFTEKQLQQAIIDSNLEDLILNLPDGLDTSVGEGGRSLSGGQRQRIALARGLIRGRTVILIDEGTSSLDNTSALKIEDSLMNNPELTVIMITHNLREPIKQRLDGILKLA